jgi:hypothetical protein
MTKNMAYSVHTRLLNTARSQGRLFNELLQYFAMERFLYRLSKSIHGSHLILKGALMMRVWDAPTGRPTRDIDLLGYLSNEIADIVAAVRDICRVETQPDGIVFDEHSVRGSTIKEGAEYEGVRVILTGFLGTAKIPIQLDFGFGDVVTPGPQSISYPTILDFPAPLLRGYPRETVIAEKFHAMVQLGTLNSRMKDFCDIWLLSRQFDFDADILGRALTATFSHRKTTLPFDLTPICLRAEFTESASAKRLWVAFIRRQTNTGTGLTLADVTAEIDIFLMALVRTLGGGAKLKGHWKSPGPWTT